MSRETSRSPRQQQMEDDKLLCLKLLKEEEEAMRRQRQAQEAADAALAQKMAQEAREAHQQHNALQLQKDARLAKKIHRQFCQETRLEAKSRDVAVVLQSIADEQHVAMERRQAYEGNKKRKQRTRAKRPAVDTSDDMANEDHASLPSTCPSTSHRRKKRPQKKTLSVASTARGASDDDDDDDMGDLAAAWQEKDRTLAAKRRPNELTEESEDQALGTDNDSDANQTLDTAQFKCRTYNVTAEQKLLAYDSTSDDEDVMDRTDGQPITAEQKLLAYDSTSDEEARNVNNDTTANQPLVSPLTAEQKLQAYDSTSDEEETRKLVGNVQRIPNAEQKLQVYDSTSDDEEMEMGEALGRLGATMTERHAAEEKGTGLRASTSVSKGTSGKKKRVRKKPMTRGVSRETLQYTTPTVYRVFQRFFPRLTTMHTEEPLTYEPNQWDASETLSEAKRVTASPSQIFHEFPEKIQYRSVTVDGQGYAVNDYVAMSVDKEAHIGQQPIARILSIEKKKSTRPVSAGSRRRRPTPPEDPWTMHVLWLYGGMDTEMKRSMAPHERYLSLHCDFLSPATILRKVVVHLCEPDAILPEHALKDHFYVRMAYDECTGAFRHLTEMERKPDYAPFVCRRCNDTTGDGRLDAKETQLVKRGFTYRPGDTVLLYNDQNCFDIVVLASFTLETVTVYPFRPRGYQPKRTLAKPLACPACPDRVAFMEVFFDPRPTTLSFRTFDRLLNRPCRVYLGQSPTVMAHLQTYLGAGDEFFCHRMTDGRAFTADLLSAYAGVTRADQATRTPMKGMELYCGSGGLSCGLQASGFCTFHWAMDVERDCCESYAMNHEDLPRDNIVHANCTDMLKWLTMGPSDKTRHMPKPGEVDVLVAGPPCQGFSHLNDARNSAGSEQNNSAIATYLGYVEHYKPRFVLLENVHNMTKTTGGDKDSILGLIITVFLKMGYQVRFTMLNAGHYGTAQHRRRFFLWAAALGNPLPHFPRPSHEFIANVNLYYVTPMYKSIRTRIISPRSNYLVDFAEANASVNPMLDDPYSHRMLTVRDALSNIAPDDALQSVLWPLSEKYLNRIRAVAPGKNYHSIQHGLREPYLSTRKDNDDNYLPNTYRRLEWDGRFETIITNPKPSGKSGAVIHPNEDRVLSVREYARAQGYPDWYEFYGQYESMYKQIGNSVPPPLAYAIGRAASLSLPRK